MKRKITQEELKTLLVQGKVEELREIISTIHPVDILDIIHEDEETAPLILAQLDEEIIADIVEEEDDEDKYEILKLFSDAKSYGKRWTEQIRKRKKQKNCWQK